MMAEAKRDTKKKGDTRMVGTESKLTRSECVKIFSFVKHVNGNLKKCFSIAKEGKTGECSFEISAEDIGGHRHGLRGGVGFDFIRIYR